LTIQGSVKYNSIMYRIEVPQEKIDKLLGKQVGITDVLRTTFLRTYMDGIVGKTPNSYSGSDYNITKTVGSISVQIYKEVHAFEAFNKLVNYDDSIIFFHLNKDCIVQTMAWISKHCKDGDYKIVSLLGEGIDLVFTDRDKALQYKLSITDE